MAERARRLAGVLLVAAGLAVLSAVPLFFWQSASGAKRLLQEVPIPRVRVVTAPGVLYPDPAVTRPAPAMGSPVGLISIAAIGLRDPVVEGATDSQLRDAVGHLQGTPLPGEMGTSILAGHNVTFFHQIGNLEPGDRIRVDTAQGVFVYRVMGHRILRVGQALDQTRFPSLVLETCYPFGDWNLTPYRYVVLAALVHSALSR